MTTRTLQKSIFERRAAGAGTALLAALMIFGALLADRPAAAGGSAATAAAIGNAGVGACSSTSGRAVYDCVANALDQMNNELAHAGEPEATRAIQTATSQLRAATSKVQALSAITQCRTALAGLLQQARAAGRDSQGLSAIAGVLAQAARLIQTKG